MQTLVVRLRLEATLPDTGLAVSISGQRWATRVSRTGRSTLQVHQLLSSMPLTLCVFVAVMFAGSSAEAASPNCKLGTTRCIKSQDTEIPSKQVVEISDYCADFTHNDVGRIALRLSYKEILARSGGRVSPLVKAWYAFDYLYNSPLKFERKKRAEDTNYPEIKRSCEQLDRDFNNDSKWTN